MKVKSSQAEKIVFVSQKRRNSLYFKMIMSSFTKTNRSIGVQLELQSGHLVGFWSVHLDYKSFGPYAANNKMVTSVDQILAGERPMNRAGKHKPLVSIITQKPSNKFFGELLHIITVLYKKTYHLLYVSPSRVLFKTSPVIRRYCTMCSTSP